MKEPTKKNLIFSSSVLGARRKNDSTPQATRSPDASTRYRGENRGTLVKVITDKKRNRRDIDSAQISAEKLPMKYVADSDISLMNYTQLVSRPFNSQKRSFEMMLAGTHVS